MIIKLNEMAFSQSQAIDRSIELGKRFIEHFHKMYSEPNSQAFNHWSAEMNTWYKAIRDIKLKSTNKPLRDGQIRDWFFTAGGIEEDFMSNTDEIEFYDKFCTTLLANKDLTILDAFLKTQKQLN